MTTQDDPGLASPAAFRGEMDDDLGYRPTLDGLRAVAITLVLFTHTAAFLAPSVNGDFFPGGFLGVDLFFVLSGFLITTLLLERRRRDRRPIATFYLRRVLRLLPAVAVLLVADLLYAMIERHGVHAALNSVLVVMAYVTNWAMLAGVQISGYVTHLWSLAIEEQFYLVWPVALFTLLKLWPSRRRAAWLLGGLTLVVAAWRGYLYLSGDGWLRIYIRTDARADALAIGAILALLPWKTVARTVGARSRTLIGGTALVSIIVAAASLKPSAKVLYLGGFTAVAVAAAVAIAMVLDQNSGLARLLSRRPLLLVGRWSYSLYLWHFGIFQIVATRTAAWSTAPRIVVAWGLTFAAAGASYQVVERPGLQLRTRLRGAARAPGVPPAGTAAAAVPTVGADPLDAPR